MRLLKLLLLINEILQRVLKTFHGKLLVIRGSGKRFYIILGLLDNLNGSTGGL